MAKFTGERKIKESFESRGIKPGTERTRTVLDRLHSPDKYLKTVHIAGSNGKGSVAEFVTQILVAAGKKVGTFTSPEVYSYNGQFRINGAAISEKKLNLYLNKAENAAECTGSTKFEIETAAALYAFYSEGCEYAVVECGMGGKEDSTNAVICKEVAVITSVSLEHMQYLGNTLEEIALHKVGIISGCPAVVSACVPEEVRGIFVPKGAVFAEPVEITGPCSFNYGGREYELTAKGSRQPYNAACAIEVAKILKIPENAVYAGIKAAYPEGRAQKLTKNGKTYILDGAHNAEAAEALADFIKTENYLNGVSLVYGCLSDKDPCGFLKKFSGLVSDVTVVKADSPRAMDTEKICFECRKFFGNVKQAGSVSAALDSLCGQAIVVTGSFTVLKEAKEWIEKK